MKNISYHLVFIVGTNLFGWWYDILFLYYLTLWNYNKNLAFNYAYVLLRDVVCSSILLELHEIALSEDAAILRCETRQVLIRTFNSEQISYIYFHSNLFFCIIVLTENLFNTDTMFYDRINGIKQVKFYFLCFLGYC